MYSLQDLLYLMTRLRDPKTGCPWDVKQTYSSIVPHTLEEAYEVADAIRQQDWPHVEEELGDLLFQVIFYAQIGQENAHFNFDSIVNILVEKLIRRHPHVFPEGTLNSERDPLISPEESEVQGRWESIKVAEKADQEQKTDSIVLASELMADIPLALPALTRAQKIQKKASSVGFDWQEIRGVIDKIQEELQEVEDEIEGADAQRLQHEVGDLLFAVVNLSRHLKVDSEQALRETNERFQQRFTHVEKSLAKDGKIMSRSTEGATSQEMEAAWEEAKRVLESAPK